MKNQGFRSLIIANPDRTDALVVTSDNQKPIAFMGIDAGRIEMLFVLPDYFGRGVGRQLAKLGISQYAQQIIAYL